MMWQTKLILAVMVIAAGGTVGCGSKPTHGRNLRSHSLSSAQDASISSEPVKVDGTMEAPSLEPPSLEPLFTSTDQLAPINLNLLSQALTDSELTEQDVAERLSRFYLTQTSSERLALAGRAAAEQDAVEQECIAKTMAEKTKIHTADHSIAYELDEDIFDCIKTKRSDGPHMRGSFRLFGRLQLKCAASFQDVTSARFGENIDALLARCGDGEAHLLMQFYSTFMIRLGPDEEARDYSLSSVSGISTQDGQACLVKLSGGRSNLSNGCLNYKATSKKSNMFAPSPKPLQLSELFISESKGVEYLATPGKNPLKGSANIILSDWKGSITFSENSAISYDINKNDRRFKGTLKASP